jgi:catechol 2,3-dioxygenase-like lactoylglutathione lyase family enzyme
MCLDGSKKFVESPDGYWFLLTPNTTLRSGEKIGEGIFQYVSLHVQNVSESIDFYRDALDAEIVYREIDSALLSPPSVLLSFAGPQSVHLEVVELDPAESLERREAFGRFALATEDLAPMKISESIDRLLSLRITGIFLHLLIELLLNRYKPSGRGLHSVLHGPMKLNPHGEEVVIVQDPDGHELCFVGARGFKTCIDVANSEVNCIPFFL